MSSITNHAAHARQATRDLIAEQSGDALEILGRCRASQLRASITCAVSMAMPTATPSDAALAADNVLAMLAGQGGSEQMWSAVAAAVNFEPALIDNVMRQVVGPVVASRDATYARPPQRECATSEQPHTCSCEPTATGGE